MKVPSVTKMPIIESIGKRFDVLMLDACRNVKGVKVICPVSDFLEEDNVKLLGDVVLENGLNSRRERSPRKPRGESSVNT